MKFYSYAGFLKGEYKGYIVTPFNEVKEIYKEFNRLIGECDKILKCHVYIKGDVETIEIIQGD